MKLIKPSFEILEQEPNYDGMLRHIEKCGRTCYKSEDRITEDSAEKFVDMIINRGHTAMLEHGTVYLKYYYYYNDNPNSYGYDWEREQEVERFLDKYERDKYSEVVYYDKYAYITTNYRVLILHKNWLDDLQYLCEPTEHHVKRVTVKFTCDRGVSHEFVRHRVFSFAQESTRYCNYSKDKFGKECTFIIPSWLPELQVGSYADYCTYDVIDYEWTVNDKAWYPSPAEHDYLELLHSSEYAYFELLDKGWIPQQARAVLPNSLKTELIMTGTIEQWESFFKLRDASDAHPQARELAHPLHEEFIKRGLL